MTSRRLTTEQARVLTLDTEPYLSCDECFELVDRHVEALRLDPDAEPVPGMTVHLAGCPACAEEAESLLELLAGDDPDPSGPVGDG